MSSLLSCEMRQKLLACATEALAKSYSPYSKLRMGAALLTESGHIFTGTNVENVCHSLAICSERVAIFNAVSAEGPRVRIKAIALATSAHVPISPCGACRQVIQEFGYDCVVIYPSYNGMVDVLLSELLPGPFDGVSSAHEEETEKDSL